MKLKVITKAKNSWPRFHRDVVKVAAEWGINELGLNDRGTLSIKLINKESYQGQALWLHNDNYVVHICSHKDVDEVVSTLFHELTHIKQYLFDGFDMSTGAAEWRGATYKVTGSYWNYWKSPWERQARKMEKRLLKKYMEE